MSEVLSEPSVADDLAARALALDPSQSFIVQAPAGSGKTELLVQRVLRLLATVENPAEVLAITFTKKAAGEMRERVLRALIEAAQSDEPMSSPARERWQLARLAVQRDIERGWRLIERPAQINIDTFDAFSLRIAKLAPLEEGVQNAGLYALEEDASANYQEAARRALLDADNLASVQTAQAAETLLVALDNRVEAVVDSIATLLSKRALWIERFVDDSDDAIARFRATIQASVERELSVLATSWPSAETARVCSLAAYAESHVADPAKRNSLQALASAGLLARSVDSLPEWAALADFLLTDRGEWRKSINVRDGFPADSERGLDAESKRERREAKATMLGLVGALRDADVDGALSSRLNRARGLPDLAAIARQESVLRAALRLLKIAAAELHLIERARASTDFSGIAIAAKLALNNHREEVFSRLDSKISHILVDEFQDTNPSQLSLLEALVDPWSEGDGHSVFIVGDPMQSIYAFRDADVGIFTDVWSHGLQSLALTPLTLSANYRSQPNIVQWVNDSLQSVFSVKPARLDLPVVPFARALATRPEAPRVPTLPGVTGIEAYADSQAEATAITTEIRRLQGVSPKSRIAIIVRARSHADALVRTLEAEQIAFVAQDMSPWIERSLIRDLISLTYVIAQPEDRLSWYSWLRSPIVGLTLEALSLIAEQATHGFFLSATREATFLDRLSHEDRVRLESALSAISRSQAAAHLHSLSSRVFQVFFDCVGDALSPTPELKDEVEAYLSFLDEVCDNAFLPPRAILEARIAKSHRSFAYSPRVLADAWETMPAPVELLTVHKAKGLEWDYVFLPQLSRGTPSEKRQLITWSFSRFSPIKQGRSLDSYQLASARARPAAQLLVAAKDTRRRAHRSVFDYVHERAAALRDEESKRLLYVAVTRAREGLWLSASAPAAASGYPKGSLARLLVDPVAAEDAGEQATATDAPISKRLVMRDSLLRIPLDRLPSLVTGVAPGSLSFLTRLGDRGPRQTRPAVLETASDATNRAGEIAAGIVGHKLIEGLSRARARGAPFAYHDRFVRRALLEGGCPATEVDSMAELLRLCVERMEVSAHFAFIHSTEHLDALDEAPLVARRSAEAAADLITPMTATQTYRVDRTFVSADGVRWLIDYKFSSRADPEPHRKQLSTYAGLFKALEPQRNVNAALYFPRQDELIIV